MAASRKSEQKQQAVILAERKSAYSFAIETVRSQLSCRANINMKDLGTAVNKLRELDLAKYQKAGFGQKPKAKIDAKCHTIPKGSKQIQHNFAGISG